MSKKIESMLAESERRTLLRLSTAGSVDDGKSTLIGRLLHDTKSVYEDHIEGIRGKSKNGSGEELDFALLTDGLKAEREQGITIDVAYRYFSSPKRHFIMADTPGHVQYTRNMATGASTSNLALLLVDARYGMTEQTKRHAFISSLLGVPRILVAINKMDLVEWKEDVYEQIRADFTNFARKLAIREIHFIPVSALKGDNVVNSSDHMPWYQGPSVLSYLEDVYVDSDRNLIDFRFPVQTVIRPNQDYRGFAGRLTSGTIHVGDEVIVLPSHKRSKVKSLDTFKGTQEVAFSPQSVTITLEDEIDISRGDMIVRVNNIPNVRSQFESILIWMDDKSKLSRAKSYRLLHGNRAVRCHIDNIRYRVDVSDLSREQSADLALNEIGRVSITSQSPLYLDSYQKNRETGSFVLVDDLTNATVAAGLVIDRNTIESLPILDDEDDLAAPATESMVFAEKETIPVAEREEKGGHKAITLWFTGLSGAGKSTIGSALEQFLFDNDVGCYRLDGDNMRSRLNTDLGFDEESRAENIRRAAEVARILNQSGQVAICTFVSPYERDREIAKQIIGADRFVEIALTTPLEVCEIRDAKGLYRKARAGVIKNFTGIDAAYEPPTSPDVEFSSAECTPAECVRVIMDTIGEKIWPK